MPTVATPPKGEHKAGSMVVQSLIFAKPAFDLAKAKAWAKEHGYRSAGADETDESIRIRQRNPGDFQEGTFRTITLTKGVKAVAGKLKTEKLGEIQGLQVFETGTYRGREWREKDLDAIVKNFQAHPEIKPPVVLGHDEEQDLLANSGLPAGGWPTRLWRSGTKLLADVADVPNKLVDLINRKAYRRTSAELYLDFHGDGPALRRVALLGGEIPEVKTLDDVAACYDEAAGETVTVFMDRREITTLAELADELAAMDKQDRPRRIIDAFNRRAWNILDGMTADRKGDLTALVDELKNILDHEEFGEQVSGARDQVSGKDLLTPDTRHPTPSIKEPPMTDEERQQFEGLSTKVNEMAGTVAQLTEAVKAKDEQIKELEKRDGHRATVAKVTKVDQAVQRLSEGGQYLPKWTSQGLKQVLLSLPDDEASVAKFAEGEGATDETPLDAALRILGTFPKMVSFGETATWQPPGAGPNEVPKSVKFTEQGHEIEVPVPDEVAEDYREHREDYALTGTTLAMLVRAHRAQTAR